MVDGFVDKCAIFDGYLYCPIRADLHAASAAAAGIVDYSTTIYHMYGVHEANIFQANFAAGALVGYGYSDTRHLLDLVTNERG